MSGSDINKEVYALWKNNKPVELVWLFKVWLGFMASNLPYAYILNMICEHIL